MITRIRAENFKSWKDTGDDLRPAPLTGLFGANNSGKTSILQMLLVMKQTVEHRGTGPTLLTSGSLVDLGTFSDIIYGHQSNAELQLSFSWKLAKPLVISDLEEQEKELLNIRELSFTTVIREDFNRMLVKSLAYEFDDYRFETHRTNGNVYEFFRRHLRKATGDNLGRFSGVVKCYGFPESGPFLKYRYLMDFARAFEHIFKRLAYVGPVRERPRRSYAWSGMHPYDVGVRGEQTHSTLMAARVDDPESAQKEDRIRKALHQMGLIYSIRFQRTATDGNDYEFHVQAGKANPEVLITDVGSGISQILPLLVQCYYAPENSIILLEQPESHLHPSAQAELADVLIDVVKDKERNIQIILESHSEHLLRRIQRRIAEEKISPDTVALYFCRMESGESKIDPLKLDEFGNIRNWPQNFFGDEMGELVAMTEAAMKRKIESGS